MKFFNQNNQYKEANLWMEKLRVREEQKQTLPTNCLSVTTVLEQQVLPAQVSRTIFSKADLGHDKAETNKISQIYQELEGLPLMSSLAGA